MYTPSHFAETQQEELHRIITEYPLGVLVTTGDNGLDADHLPFELDVSSGAQGHLLAHVARNNPLWEQCRDGAEVLVIFRAADAYISPNWYPSKHETHQQVPTWNYQVVHVHGKMHIRDDPQFVRGMVARLTRTHEARTGSERPWKMTDAPREYIDQMLTAIVGIEIEITAMIGKSKLSQNKDMRDRIGAVQGLQQQGQQEMAEAMLKKRD